MKSRTSREVPWLGLLWLVVLTASSAILTILYTCVTPFAAFAAITVTKLSRRQALFCVVATWLGNQMVGFGVLNYPRTADSFGWGIAMGVAAVLGTLAAEATMQRLPSQRSSLQTIVGFVSAFVLYELTLYAAATSILGGTGAFAPSIVGQVVLVNVVALVGLFGLSQLVSWGVSVQRRHRADASPVRFA